MRLYAGMSTEFIRDTVRNQITDKLKNAHFAQLRYNPSRGVINSWRNSLRAMAHLMDHAGFKDHGVLLEYQLALCSGRIDCLICGADSTARDQAVIVELKQWDSCQPHSSHRLVRTWINGQIRSTPHPSVQVKHYMDYMADGHEVFHPGASRVQLSACSYLHNYTVQVGDPLIDPKFAAVIDDCPLFDADNSDGLAEFLASRLSSGDGGRVLDRIERSRYRPSKKLMDHLSTTIRNRAPWTLLDNQIVAYEEIRTAVALAQSSRTKHVVLVHGGPGTGKSVIAINVVADALRDGINAHYATGSKAFTKTLWKIIGSRAKTTFRYFNSYSRAEHDSVDVLVCDEAHRIRETSSIRFTKRDDRSDLPQIVELIRASKACVFFIDDRQVVRPNEVGSSDYIRLHAESLGCRITELELEAQFRCGGSEGFVNWIENTLGIRRTANVIWDSEDGFDFRIFRDVGDLESAIQKKADDGHSARLVAGFCWPWSAPRSDGTLVEDIVIGDFKRPWNAKEDAGDLAEGIPESSLWATDPNGINQIGCVYTAQGFDLDYVGVIWGRDLVYDLDRQTWIGDKAASRDAIVKRSKDRFVDLVKNAYRVLLSRGLKGCYVYFQDKDTERFVRSRLEAENSDARKVADETRGRHGE